MLFYRRGGRGDGEGEGGKELIDLGTGLGSVKPDGPVDLDSKLFSASNSLIGSPPRMSFLLKGRV